MHCVWLSAQVLLRSRSPGPAPRGSLELCPEGRIRAVVAAVTRGGSPAGSEAGEAEGCWERRGSGRGARAGAGPGCLLLERTRYKRASVLSQQGRGQGGGPSMLPSFVCKGNKLWLRGCPLSPSLGKAQKSSQRNPKNLSPERRHCCSTHLLRFQGCNLQGFYLSTRRAAREGPLRGGTRVSPRTASSDLTRRSLDWLALQPTAFSFPSCLLW